MEKHSQHYSKGKEDTLSFMSHLSPLIWSDTTRSTAGQHGQSITRSVVVVEEDPNSSTQTSKASNRVLSTLAVVTLCYFNVSGGPMGSEEIISSGGPLVGLLGIIVFPLVWSVPVALVTAELSTAFPNDGGYTVWVYHALGSFWGFQEGYLSWISGVVDNAIYPTLTVSLITQAYNVDFGSQLNYLFKVCFTIILSLPGLFGVEVVGRGLTVLALISSLPFLVLIISGIPKMNWSVLAQVRHANMTEHSSDFDGSGPVAIRWHELANILFWNFNGFDGASVFAGEVKNPSKTYPRALALSVLFVVLAYLLPLMVAVCVNEPLWSEWKEGSFSKIGRSIGGEFLVSLILIGSIGSNIGMFMTELFVDSFQLVGMAEIGLAPKLFARRHSKYNTPCNAIYASVVIMLGLLAFDFNVILIITNCVCSLSITLITVAAIVLRFKMPHINRPYKVPGGILTLCAIVTIPAFFSIYIVIVAIEDTFAMIAIFCVFAMGVVFYYLQAFFCGMPVNGLIFIGYISGLVDWSDYYHKQQHVKTDDWLTKKPTKKMV